MADRADINNIHGRAGAPLSDKKHTQGTRETYRRAVGRFDTWLAGRSTTDAELAVYLGTLFDRDLTPAYATVAVAAAADRAKCERAPSPGGELTAAALCAFRRDGAGRGPGQVVGIIWEQADRMAELAEVCGDAAGLRDALFTRIASACLLRVGEASALDRADISFAKDGGLLVTVRRSKTDQEGKGSTHYAGRQAARLARVWLETAGIEEGPLFRPVNKAGAVAARPLGERSLRTIVKRRAAAAGIEGRVSGHSFRVGAAQSLRDAGATTAELMAEGRWKRVETMAHYTREQDAAAGAVARLRYGVVPPDGRAPLPVPNPASEDAVRASKRVARWWKRARDEWKDARKVAKRVKKGLQGSKKP